MILAGVAELSKISWSLQRDQSPDHAVTDSNVGNPLGWYTHLLGRTAGQQLHVLSEHSSVASGHISGHAELLSPQPGQDPYQGDPASG